MFSNYYVGIYSPARKALLLDGVLGPHVLGQVMPVPEWVVADRAVILGCRRLWWCRARGRERRRSRYTEDVLSARGQLHLDNVALLVSRC